MKSTIFAFIAAITMVVPASVSASDSSYDVAEKIHNEVNRDIKYRDDKKDGVEYYDSWNLPVDNKGDCEDISLLKKKRLIEAGFQPEDVDLIIVGRQFKRSVFGSKQRVIQAHVVVYIRSLDIVLDNSFGRKDYVGNLKIYPYDRWMHIYGGDYICTVVDESIGDIPTIERCGPINPDFRL